MEPETLLHRHAFLAEGGVAGASLRKVDWSATPLGSPEGWPSALKTTVGIVLHSRQPMCLWWGPELIQIYNDAYLPSLGDKHPLAMGQRGRECWGEIWPIIWPQIEDVMSRAKPSWNEDQLVPIYRNGRIEEVYWTYGYSPVIDDCGRVGGTLALCTETTTRVLAERRLRLIGELADKVSRATDGGALLAVTASVLERATKDAPFVCIYERGPEPQRFRLAKAINLRSEAAVACVSESFSRWRERQRVETDRAVVSIALPEVVGPWPEPIREAFVAPIGCAGRSPSGYVVFGVSPRLTFDSSYRDFFVQLAEQLTLAHARVEAARARATYESQRESLLARAPLAAALVTGPDHVFQLANPVFQQLTGRRELTGKPLLEAVPELGSTPLPAIIDHVYATGEPFSASEFAAWLDLDQNGRLHERFFSFNFEPLRAEDQSVYGIMAVATDVTEHVKVRRVLERAHAEREKLLSELEAANRAKDEFLAMLGHELRNPLSPIVTALELMRMHPGRDNTAEQRVIERQVRHLVRLVDDLLDVAKITRGKVELKHETLEISEVLTKAVEIASHLFEQRRHRLTMDVPRQGLAWTGDPVRIAQAVANLLTNAARYTKPGGNIALRAEREGDELVIGVKDDGIGISQEMLPRVFDLFVQGKRNPDRAEGGLGIGLALVKNLVSLHGGVVIASSAGPDRGSEFVIRLPITTPSASAEAPKAFDLTLVNGATRRILVVDDNQDSADLLRTMLDLAGHEVAVAHDPLAALAVAERFTPEVAILDIGLPVMDGYELAARLREQAGGAGCKLIALTGYGQLQDRARSARAGFGTHLVKPVELEQLMQVIREA